MQPSQQDLQLDEGSHPVTKVSPHSDLRLVLRWPWWLHPAWGLMLLTGLTLLLTLLLSEKVFWEIWRSPKFIDEEYSLLLLIAVIITFVGMIVSGGFATESRTMTLEISERQVLYLRRAYVALFVLSVTGYVLWIGVAVTQGGVRIADLQAVLTRSEGAIGSLKENARPIGGLTTLTQFAPPAVTVGFLLKRLGVGGWSFLWLVGLSCLRVLFYAERLALIEVLIPLVLLAAISVPESHSGLRWQLVRVGPIIAVPVVWTVFAASEFTRSWVWHQQLTDKSFPEWVSLRLLGYYATSFNNSALLAEASAGVERAPYFTIHAFWNAPGVAQVLEAPPAEDWWMGVLTRTSNPEFNNVGSFLTVYSEFGFIGMAAYWGVIGLIAGFIYRSVLSGSVPSLIAYACLYLGVLELPRFIYWAQGRAVPVVLTLILIALTYPKVERQVQRMWPRSMPQ